MNPALAVALLSLGAIDALHINDQSRPGSEVTDTENLISDDVRERHLRDLAGEDAIDSEHSGKENKRKRRSGRRARGDRRRGHRGPPPEGVPHGKRQTDLRPDDVKHNGTDWCMGRDTRHFCDATGASLPTSELVVSTFWEDLEWLSEYDGPVQVFVHNRTDERSHCYGCPNEAMHIAIRSQEKLERLNPTRKDPINFTDIRNVGDEASGYLMYIIKNYERLPDMMMFIHGHQCSRHNTFDMLHALRRIRGCFTAQHGYMDLNDMVDTPVCYSGYMSAARLEFGTKLRVEHMNTVWPSLFQEEFGNKPDPWCLDPYAQFAVARERVLSHKKAYYERLLGAVLEGETTLEYFWRLLFVPGMK